MAGLTSSILRSLRQVSKTSFSGLKPIRTIPACTSTSTRQHHEDGGSAETPDHKFYELRTYKIKPENFGAFSKLTNENIGPRLGHSKLIGYWTVDIGSINEVFHIWEYDCYAQRTAVRAALAKDETWQSTYFSKAVQMLDSQENAAAKLLPWKPLQEQPMKEGGVYELRCYVMKPGGLDTLKERIMLRDEFYSSDGCGKLMGAWMGDVGHVNTFYALWNFVSADKRLETRAGFLKTDASKQLAANQYLTTDMRSKLLIANPFSPLK